MGVIERYNYNRLLGKMRERGLTQVMLAKQLGISETSLNLSLNNKRDFKQDEMVKACEILGVPLSDVADYFFLQIL